ARKSERILLRVFGVRPAAAALIAASFALIGGRSSTMQAGASPMSLATRVTAERKSRSRFGEISRRRSRAATTDRRVCGAACTEEAVVAGIIRAGPLRSRGDRG